MLRGIYTAAATMAAQEGRVEVASNNLANADTAGFKRELALLGSGPSRLVGRQEKQSVGTLISSNFYPLNMMTLGNGLWDVATDMRQGPLKETGNKSDLALSGRGFFSIHTSEGMRFTRSGAFLINSQGFISTLDGGLLLSESGNPIYIGSQDFTISQEGEIYNEDGAYVDKLMIVDFPFPEHLNKVGSSYFESSPKSGDPLSVTRPKILQGYLEGSNLRVVEEMVRMISALRSYERAQKVVQSYDDTLGRAVNDVGKV
jgi:flagellar basal-body rod protein FlgF